MEKLLGFHGVNYFLSNFYPSVITLDEIEYPTLEHAYQAAKTLNPIQRQMIREANTPGAAKKLGRKVDLRPDWEQIKLKIMYDLVKQKFAGPLKQSLLNTGDAYLEETNWWHDTFWGVCDGIGKNWLGKILMAIRKELKDEDKNKN